MSELGTQAERAILGYVIDRPDRRMALEELTSDDFSHPSLGAIWDGIAAFRCLRELAPPDEDPSLDDLTAEQRTLFDAASSQLLDALTYGLASVVRAKLVEQATVCDVDAEANWAFLKVLGPVLDHEGNLRNAAAYAPAAALWAAPAPMDEVALVAAVAALDAVFPCPY